MNANAKPVCNESLVVRCPPDMRDALEKIAGDRRKLSATVRAACAEYIRRMEGGASEAQNHLEKFRQERLR